MVLEGTIEIGGMLLVYGLIRAGCRLFYLFWVWELEECDSGRKGLFD